MKTTLSLVVVLAFSLTAVAVAVENDGNAVSVLANSSSKVILQDEVVPPAPVPTAPEAPAVVADQTVMEGPIVMEGSAVMMSPACGGCNTCCATPCRCCPPPPVSMTFCLQDPCCCSHEVSVCVPACCAGEEPCISWRKGLFGRQIATMCWACCNHEVKVTICRSGKVKVRD